MSSDDLERLATGVCDLLRAVAREPIEDGRANLEITFDDDPAVKLEPRNPAAAALEVAIDSLRLVTCFPGANEMVYEIAAKGQDELLDGVRALAQALVSGGYSERVKESSDKPKVAAMWKENGKSMRAHRNVLWPPRTDGRGWRSVRYEPY